jgi:hypothetical protein
MWILIISIVLPAGFLAILLGFLPPLNATTLIRVRAGRLQVRKGQLRPHAKEQVGDILREAGVSNCFIAITGENRVVFSRCVPSSIHQQLRNVILNQWA